MATSDSSRAAERGKPTATLDHVSIAPGAAGGISITVTITIGLDDVQALDMMLRAVGTIARSRGIGDRP